MTDEKIKKDHTEKIKRLIGSLSGLEDGTIPDSVKEVKIEAKVVQRNKDSDFGGLLNN